MLHVKPENGTKSLEETVGNALTVNFSTPDAHSVSAMGAWGYPAAPPYDGLKMFKCVDRPGRLSVAPSTPAMYRIGCTMTGGSSGGGWFITGKSGKAELVSNTSIGPVTSGWLAGPQLGSRRPADLHPDESEVRRPIRLTAPDDDKARPLVRRGRALFVHAAGQCPAARVVSAWPVRTERAPPPAPRAPAP